MNSNHLETKEEHPWKRFPQENGTIKYLILGSFPPKKFTTNTDKLLASDVCFFYGSNDNHFWDLFCYAKNLDLNWRCEPDTLRCWLIENHWGVSDIVLKASRAEGKKESAADTSLRQIEYNDEVLKNIFSHNEIEKIFFTSKWVKDKFEKRNINSSEKISNQITLISPSPNGLRVLDWAKKVYETATKQKIDNNTSNSAFRKMYYKYFLNT